MVSDTTQYISLTDENLDKLGLRTEEAMKAAKECVLSLFARSYAQIFQECMDKHTHKTLKIEKPKYETFIHVKKILRETLSFLSQFLVTNNIITDPYDLIAPSGRLNAYYL
jgi:hypothetical protein